MPLRIAYLIERDVSHEDAVVKKVAAQLRCWEALGHEVSLYVLSPTAEVSPALDGLPLYMRHRRGRLDWLTRYRSLVDDAIAWRPSVAYFRFSTYFPPVGKLMRAVPTVVEINTNDVEEYRATMTHRSYLYHRLTRRRIFQGCRGVVTVSRELEDTVRIFGQPVVTISNGIDLDRFAPLPPAHNAAPRAVFLGTPGMPWHGVDQILRMAELNADWQFDLVGPATTDVRARVPDNVRLHGYLSRDDYEPILRKSDVAIGTLTLFLKAMHEASPLKVREYLAFGIPTIIAYRDTDFPTEVPFLLQLPSEPDVVQSHLSSIRDFVQRVKGTRVPRQDIRHLDVRCKEEKRLQFFTSVVESARHRR